MEYYLIENEKQTGPFTIEELKAKGVNKSTLVWTKGIKEWTEARHIPMLKDIIEETPPEYIKPTNDIPPPPPGTAQQKATVKYFGYTLATRWERFIAFIVGGLIIAIPLLIILMTIMPNSYWDSDNYRFTFADIVLDIIIGILLGAIFYPLWSGNIGHKIFGLKVISKETGEDVKSSIEGAKREALKNILWHFIVPMIWLFWDKDTQNLYDKIVKTIVVKKKEE